MCYGYASRIVAVSIIVTSAISFGPATQGEERWGIRPGEFFRVETVILQKSSIVIDDSEPSVREWTERIEAAYRKLPSESN